MTPRLCIAAVMRSGRAPYRSPAPLPVGVLARWMHHLGARRTRAETLESLGAILPSGGLSPCF